VGIGNALTGRKPAEDSKLPLKIQEQDAGETLIVHAIGTLTKSDYERFEREFEYQVCQHGSLHVLVDLTGFHGLEAGALWDEVKFDMKHFADIERLAVVGDKQWQHSMTTFFKPFTKATVHYFDFDSVFAEARKWLGETERPIGEV
jgi:hypothetical protein